MPHLAFARLLQERFSPEGGETSPPVTRRRVPWSLRSRSKRRTFLLFDFVGVCEGVCEGVCASTRSPDFINSWGRQTNERPKRLVALRQTTIRQTPRLGALLSEVRHCLLAWQKAGGPCAPWSVCTLPCQELQTYPESHFPPLILRPMPAQLWYSHLTFCAALLEEHAALFRRCVARVSLRSLATAGRGDQAPTPPASTGALHEKNAPRRPATPQTCKRAATSGQLNCEQTGPTPAFSKPLARVCCGQHHGPHHDDTANTNRCFDLPRSFLRRAMPSSPGTGGLSDIEAAP